jgi:hypothetical protein
MDERELAERESWCWRTRERRAARGKTLRPRLDAGDRFEAEMVELLSPPPPMLAASVVVVDKVFLARSFARPGWVH